VVCPTVKRFVYQSLRKISLLVTTTLSLTKIIENKKGAMLNETLNTGHIKGHKKVAWKSFKNVTANFWGEILRQKTNVKWWLILWILQSYGV